MKVLFFVKDSNKCPVKEFIDKLEVKDRAKVLACLKSIEDLGFSSPRVQFRQIQGRLWEIKIRSQDAGYRIFYVNFEKETIVLLHAYKKQSQKAPRNEIEIAMKRMIEVLKYENYHA